MNYIKFFLLVFCYLVNSKLAISQGCCPSNYYISIGNCVVDYNGNIGEQCSTEVCADENCNVPVTICVYGNPCIFNINFQLKSVHPVGSTPWATNDLIPLINQTFPGSVPPNNDPYCFTYLVPMSVINGKYITLDATFATGTAGQCHEDMNLQQRWIFVNVVCAPEKCLSEGGGGPID